MSEEGSSPRPFVNSFALIFATCYLGFWPHSRSLFTHSQGETHTHLMRTGVLHLLCVRATTAAASQSGWISECVGAGSVTAEWV